MKEEMPKKIQPVELQREFGGSSDESRGNWEGSNEITNYDDDGLETNYKILQWGRWIDQKM